MVIKPKHNSNNDKPNNISAGEYYVIGFIICDVTENGKAVEAGGGVMKKVKVAPHAKVEVLLNF